MTITAQFHPYSGLEHTKYLSARKCYASAQAIAESLIRQARSQAAAILIKSRQRARLRAAKVAQTARTEAFNLQMLKCEQMYINSCKKAELDCLKIALEVARAVIQDEISAKPESVLKRIQSAIEALPVKPISFTISVHPSDLKVLADSIVYAFKPDQLIADPEILPGDAKIQSTKGVIQLSWKDHLQFLQSFFIEKVSASSQEPLGH